MLPGEADRFSRQTAYPKIGEAGQVKISRSTIAVVGCGALGSVAAEALARAGVGRLILIDRDYVEWSNLQRQFLYSEADALAETPKAVAAKSRLQEINSGLDVEAHVTDCAPSNVEELLQGADIIVDGTDNFETRYLLNDFSVKVGTPWIYGAAVADHGVVMPIWPEHGPCLTCIYPEPPKSPHPTCDVDGVIAATTMAVAALQVAQTLRLLVGWDGFQASILTLDTWGGGSRKISAGQRDEQCVTCSQRSFRYLNGTQSSPVSLCGRNAVQLHVSGRPFDLQQLATRLRPLGMIRVNEFALRMQIPRYDVTFFADGRAIVRGTTDVSTAKSVYAQLVGS